MPDLHRDIKPENVFVVDDSSGFRVKLLDFGLAKALKSEEGPTQTGVILGTPIYMAPEQVQGDAVDTRADVYSFGAVAWEALTGTRSCPLRRSDREDQRPLGRGRRREGHRGSLSSVRHSAATPLPEPECPRR